MFGTISEEIEVNVPASEAWKLYGTLQLAKVIGEGIPDVIDKLVVVQGDGSAGTILEVFFSPGVEDFRSSKEIFTVVDHEKRMKEVEMVEGGYLDLGFILYRVRFEVIEKEGMKENKCITRSTIEYEVREEANAALVTTHIAVAIMQVAAAYLVKNYKDNN